MQTTATKSIFLNLGVFSSLLHFMPLGDQVKMQQLNKKAYKTLVPSYFSQVPINDVHFCLEKNRREFYIASYNAHKQEQKYFLLFKFGKATKPEENTYSAADLGFSECYFQFWVMMSDLKNHYMFPLSEEAYIQSGFHLEFDR